MKLLKQIIAMLTPTRSIIEGNRLAINERVKRLMASGD